MKKIAGFLSITLGLVALTLLGSCDLFPPAPVVVSIGAGSTGATKAVVARTLTGGEAVSPITSYRVVFKKVEIGNSESDKFTLWESAAGETKDLVSAVSFAGIQAVVPGTYNFVRLTLGDTIAVAGSVTDPADLSVYSGTGTCVLGNTSYLWGTNIANATGELTLGSAITIAEGSSLSFDFALASTVTYQSGTSTAAVLSVTKPVLTLAAR